MKTVKIYGIGMNDVGNVCYNGKALRWYSTWYSMFRRCSCAKYHRTHPTYVGCKVCEEWRTASNFKVWFDAHYIEGYQLDKDFLGEGRVYSPDTCCFVPPWLNSLLTSAAAVRGQWPLGVKLDKRDLKYCAKLTVDGKTQHIGCFDTPRAAFQAYASAKTKYILSKLPLIEPRLRQAVICKWLLIHDRELERLSND